MASAMVKSALRNVQLRRTPACSARTFSSKPGVDDACTFHFSLLFFLILFLITLHVHMYLRQFFYIYQQFYSFIQSGIHGDRVIAIYYLKSCITFSSLCLCLYIFNLRTVLNYFSRKKLGVYTYITGKKKHQNVAF